MCILEINLSEKFGGPAIASSQNDREGTYSVLQSGTIIAENIPSNIMADIAKTAQKDERQAYHRIMKYNF